ncbi:MAG: hypothetical protein ACFFAH_15640 [Promethearchaeota archaeon]
MTNNHSQSFFGQATGLTIKSSSREDPFIFLKCIKKKPDGTWEKPSTGEGKTIKCSLEEMIMILSVLKRTINSWTCFHSYKDNKTQISFSWEENGGNKLWINIGNYSKMLSLAQVEIFKLLLKHLINEKIEYATINNVSKLQNINDTNEEKNAITNQPKNLNSDATIIKNSTLKTIDSENDEKVKITGFIKAETEKALLLVFENGQEIWIPKSTIHSNYEHGIEINQSLLIDNWILRRNNITV